MPHLPAPLSSYPAIADHRLIPYRRRQMTADSRMMYCFKHVMIQFEKLLNTTPTYAILPAL